MKIEQLVPPLELCRAIPKGCFEDSALLWFSNYHFGGWHIEKRELAVAFTDNGELYPAPTLQEILEELYKYNITKEGVFSQIETTCYTVYGEELNLAEMALEVWMEDKRLLPW